MIGLKKELAAWTEEKFNVSGISNLRIIYSFCPVEVLNEILNKATVYVQLSITEGMPLSLGKPCCANAFP